MILQQSEWIIMEKLWENSPQTLMQLYHQLHIDPGWSKSTVSTMLKRMCNKNIISFEEGKAKQFYPCIKKEDAAIEETNRLLNKIYNGSISMMMSTLVKNNKMTKEDIQELYDLLNSIDD